MPPQPQLGLSDAIAQSREWGYGIPSPGRRVVWSVLTPRAENDQAATTVLPKALPRRVGRHVPGGPVRLCAIPKYFDVYSTDCGTSTQVQQKNPGKVPPSSGQTAVSRTH